MEYKIVEQIIAFKKGSLKDLESKVNDLIKEGWVPLGGITSDGRAANIQYGERFCQAMIREKEKTPTFRFEKDA